MVNPPADSDPSKYLFKFKLPTLDKVANLPRERSERVYAGDEELGRGPKIKCENLAFFSSQ